MEERSLYYKKTYLDESTALRHSNSNTLMNAGSHALLNMTNIDALSQSYMNSKMDFPGNILEERTIHQKRNFNDISQLFKKTHTGNKEPDRIPRQLPQQSTLNNNVSNNASTFFDPFSRQNIPGSYPEANDIITPSQLKLYKEHQRNDASEKKF
jgi:hypothetical protein